jgi:putative membrane protein
MWNNNWENGHMTGWVDGGWQWMMGFHGIWTVVFLAIVIFVGVALIRDWRRGHTTDSALDKLNMSYAAGDIDRDEYLNRKRDLA